MSHNISPPYVLGIHWAHDASAALCSPDGIVCAMQEDRLSRIKHYYGFPVRAIESVLSYAGITGKDLTAIAFSTTSVFYPEHKNHLVIDQYGIQQTTPISHSWIETGKQWISSFRKQSYFPQEIPPMWEKFWSRHYSQQREMLDRMGLFYQSIDHVYVHHHRAHASSAFRLSGKKDACVISADGKGDELCATIYRGKSDGRMELLRSTHKRNSLGSFYQAVTEALGFVPVDGEYKTMGLAALGKKTKKKNPFDSIMSVKNGEFISTIPWTFRSYNDTYPHKAVENPLSSISESDIFSPYLEHISPEQLAWYAQDVCERMMVAYVKDAIKYSSSDHVVGAGGVLLNVKANARIRDELNPTSFFVFPDAGDSGLAAGAAMEAIFHLNLGKRTTFSTPFLGISYLSSSVYEVLQRYVEQGQIHVKEVTVEQIATYIASGHVIGTFQERMEIGPRALGNRSVLADPRSMKTKDRINAILKGREDFVPFAPVLLYEDANIYWRGKKDYRYMTMTVRANAYAKKHVPAVVHTDGTMRPEVVRKQDNKRLYSLLLAFKSLTGIGLLINTSFNRHGLPIVGSPEDALDHLLQGWVDGVWMHGWYITKSKEAHAT